MNGPNLAKEPIVIHSSRFKAAAFCLLSLVFVLGGIWMMQVSQPGGSKENDFNWLVGLVAIIFFGGGFLVLLIALIKRPVGLILEEDGVRIGGLYGKGTFIPWEWIASFEPMKHYIVVHITDHQGFIESRRSKWQRNMYEFNFRTFGYMVTIGDNQLEKSRLELLALLHHHLNEWRERNRP